MRNDPADRLVKGGDHAHVGTTRVIFFIWIKIRIICWYFNRIMYRLKGQVEKEGRFMVIALMISNQLFYCITIQEGRVRSIDTVINVGCIVKIIATCGWSTGFKRNAEALLIVIFGSGQIAVESIESAILRQTLRTIVPQMPLSDNVRSVSGTLHLIGQSHLVKR